MRFVIMCFGALVLISCASSSEVKNIEQLMIEGQATITELDNKIELLEADRKQLNSQLTKLDSQGQSAQTDATGLREKITIIDQSIGIYQEKIKLININLAKNSKLLSMVENQQIKQHKAAALAVKENEVLKLQAVEEIDALERAYKAKRQQLQESSKEDNTTEQGN